MASSGTITYPLVGDVFVDGLSVGEAERQILQALRDVYPSVTDIELGVTPAGRFHIYVAGAVGRPGKYSFEEAPNLWNAIREAGGPTGEASLQMVRIVGDPKQGGRSTVIDVQKVLDSGVIDQLPDLNDGDTVIIPGQPADADAAARAGFGVGVYGSVVRPGTYRAPDRSTLVDALLIAGGTLPDAKMAKISIVRPVRGGPNQTITVDVREFLENGDPLSNPVVKPGDTIYVPRQNAFLWALKNNAQVVVGLIGSVVTLAIVLNNI